MTTNDYDPPITLEIITGEIEDMLCTMVLDSPDYPNWAEDEELDTWRENRYALYRKELIAKLVN